VDVRDLSLADYISFCEMYDQAKSDWQRTMVLDAVRSILESKQTPRVGVTHGSESPSGGQGKLGLP
jgi:hypothetical protein